MTAKEFIKENKPDLGLYKKGDTFSYYLEDAVTGYYLTDGKSVTDKDMKDIEDLLNLYAKEVLKIAAEKAEIGMKKKSQYGKYRKWQNVKLEEEEVDLSDYIVQY